jgi:hypothetical protein
MRLYGLQQRKRTSKSRAVSEAPSQAAIPDIVSKPASEDVDEYKLIYHQTFKGALRLETTYRHIPHQTSGDARGGRQASAIFCADPLSEYTDASNQGFGGDGKETSPFADRWRSCNNLSEWWLQYTQSKAPVPRRWLSGRSALPSSFFPRHLPYAKWRSD